MDEKVIISRLRGAEFMYNSMWYYVNRQLFNLTRMDAILQGNIIAYRKILELPNRKFNSAGYRDKKGEKIDVRGFDYDEKCLDEMGFFKWDHVMIPTHDDWVPSNWQGLREETKNEN